jgi:hypothetical protein
LECVDELQLLAITVVLKRIDTGLIVQFSLFERWHMREFACVGEVGMGQAGNTTLFI